MRRVATYGDGWHLFRHPADGLPRAIRRVRKLADAAGRDGSALALSVRCDLELLRTGAGAAPADARGDYNTHLGSRFRLRGTPDQVVEAVGELRDLGVEHLVLAVNTDDPGRVAESIGTFVAEVAARLG
jgi:alkanesulfonate monooxygenase SsuD/methylene tetrahydromethanopterin reductase-like flavin-dependent oxidoreductase (luciferase family)